MEFVPQRLRTDDTFSYMTLASGEESQYFRKANTNGTSYTSTDSFLQRSTSSRSPPLKSIRLITIKIQNLRRDFLFLSHTNERITVPF